MRSTSADSGADEPPLQLGAHDRIIRAAPQIARRRLAFAALSLSSFELSDSLMSLRETHQTEIVLADLAFDAESVLSPR